jgi:hypothetical protein
MISINAGDWTGEIIPVARAIRWRAGQWPLGAMAAAAMAATEAFKIAMRKLVCHARNSAMMMETFAPSTDIEFALAPAGTPMVSELGEFDFVSGGAITQSALFVLTRLPAVRGHARVTSPTSPTSATSIGTCCSCDPMWVRRKPSTSNKYAREPGWK